MYTEWRRCFFEYYVSRGNCARGRIILWCSFHPFLMHFLTFLLFLLPSFYILPHWQPHIPDGSGRCSSVCINQWGLNLPRRRPRTRWSRWSQTSSVHRNVEWHTVSVNKWWMEKIQLKFSVGKLSFCHFHQMWPHPYSHFGGILKLSPTSIHRWIFIYSNLDNIFWLSDLWLFFCDIEIYTKNTSLEFWSFALQCLWIYNKNI